MIEWLWDYFVLQRIARIEHLLRHGGWKYDDVIFILTIFGGCIVAYMGLIRATGDKEAAEGWENRMRETSKLAEREGWHGVLHWQRRFGLGKKATPDAAQEIEPRRGPSP